MRRILQKSGEAFAFTDENVKHLEATIKKYPKGKERSAIKEALYTAQRQKGWVSQEAVEVISEFLEVPAIHVYEVATFYTMFRLAPVGKHHLQVCTTTPCWLRGSDGVLSACQKASEKHGPEVFTTVEVECLGGCANAPILQINDDYYEDLDEAMTADFLEKLSKGETCPPGSAIGRQFAAPLGGLTTLKDQEKASSSKQSGDGDVTR